MNHRRTIPHHLGRAAAVLALAAMVAGCSVTSNGQGAWPKGDAPPLDTGASTTVPEVRSGTSLPPREQTYGINDCKDLAKGPWAKAAHGPDPIGTVRRGSVPSIDGAPTAVARPDEVQEFHTVDEYRDHSTMAEVGALHAAMQRAGFQEGIDVRWGEGHRLAAITAVRFRDAAGAQSVLTTHLTALCDEAQRATVREDGTGLMILQDSSTVRTIFVLDDLEVSVMTCSCYASTDEDREAIVEDWSARVGRELAAPKRTGDA